eukprot:scaffold31308_cov49-Attheya_sp.AAC.5
MYDLCFTTGDDVMRVWVERSDSGLVRSDNGSDGRGEKQTRPSRPSVASSVSVAVGASASSTIDRGGNAEGGLVELLEGTLPRKKTSLF